jgi:hypothetical protein
MTDYKIQLTLTCDTEDKRDTIADAVKTKVNQMAGVSGAIEVWDMVAVPRDPVIEKQNVKKEDI